MSAPERIWAWAWEVDRHRGQWTETQEIVGEGTEYLRADVSAAAIAAAREEGRKAGLEEAEAFVETHAYTSSGDTRKMEPSKYLGQDIHHATIAAAIRALMGQDAPRTGGGE